MSRSRKRGGARPATPGSVVPGREATESVSSHDAFVVVLVIAVATALAYSNTFDAPFHFDDFPNIVENQSLRDLNGQWPPGGRRWLGYLSFALNYRFGGLHVIGYHLVNLLIHVCNGLLVSWLTATTLRTPAMRRAETGPLVRRYLPLVAGLLFAVHPVATQAVTYVVQRFTSLATLFYLLSVALYAQARLALEADLPSKPRAAYLYCLSVLSAVGAMETKEIGFTLPFVAAGYDLLFFRRGKARLLLAPLALTALLVPLGLVTQGQNLADVLGNASDLAAETQTIPRSVYLLTQSRVVVTYLRLLLLPVGQNLDPDFRLSNSPADPDVLFALAILLALAACAVLLLVRARKTNRAAGVLVFFGVAWFFVTLSVESSVIPIRDVIVEHRVYLPSAGAAVTAGTALLWAIERLRLRVSLPLQAGLALLITAGPLGTAAYVRNLVWKDDFILWSDVVAKSPQKGRPHFQVGLAYKLKGQIDDAMREYREAIRLDPAYAPAHNNLGNAHKKKGELDDAIREYREAIRVAPGYARAHYNLGVAYQARGRIDDAIREYREAMRLGYIEARNRLGGISMQQDRAADAVEEPRR